MDKKYRAFAFVPLEFFALKGALQRGIQIKEGIFICNDFAEISRRVPRQSLQLLGQLQMSHAAKLPAFAYADLLLTESELADNGRQVLLDFLTHIKTFQLALWLVRDNAVSFSDGFIIVEHPDHLIATSNAYAGETRMANGVVASVDFSESDAKKARDLLHRIWSDQAPDLSSLRDGLEVESPLVRAFYFLQAARPAPVSVKVAFYCTALEALLIPDGTSELTFRLSMRIAWLLGASLDRRKELVAIVKNAYAIRSASVHGSHMKATKLQRLLLPTATAFDEVFREVFQTIVGRPTVAALFMSEKATSEAREEALSMLTLGDPLLAPLPVE